MISHFLSAGIIEKESVSPLKSKEGQPPSGTKKKESELWKRIPFQNFKSDSVDLKYKIACGNNILLLVNFPAETEKRKHKPWKWDAVKQIYVEGGDREAELYVVIAEFAADAGQDSAPSNMDIWIWRAARTDPSGFADDAYANAKSLSSSSGESESVEISQDEGVSCWFSRYFSSFAGEEIPRFYQRTPEGSSADVAANGRWEAGVWAIEFSRKLDTGHKDDISLKDGKTKYIFFSLGPPSRKSLVFSKFIRIPDIGK